jgi:putative transposase
MPDYRRIRVPGGTYFFTINLLERRSDLLVRHIDALREAVRRTRRERPFAIDAWVVLPDPMHCIITLPEGDDDVSNRIMTIKIRFARAMHADHRAAPRDPRRPQHAGLPSALRSLWQESRL